MRKLLNTLYITNPEAYLALDGENVVCKVEGEEVFRIPFLNIENILCFSYIGCSPALMGKCVENKIAINFLSPYGKFLASVSGGTRGNVNLRVAQIDKFRECGLTLTQNTMAVKFANTIQIIKRSQHDIKELREDAAVLNALEVLKKSVQNVYAAKSIEQIIGIEGNAAHQYFSVFDKLIKNDSFKFSTREKRPPLDEVNALLSFIYSIYTTEFASALETVGLDSYIGYCHTLRSGRASLACDLVEEARCLVERFCLSLINMRKLNSKDFEKQISGAVYLSVDGRKKVLTEWQEKKRTDFVHPFLKQKIQFGLLPYIQSNLLAKFVRGDIEDYPVFLNR